MQFLMWFGMIGMCPNYDNLQMNCRALDWNQGSPDTKQTYYHRASYLGSSFLFFFLSFFLSYFLSFFYHFWFIYISVSVFWLFAIIFVHFFAEKSNTFNILPKREILVLFLNLIFLLIRIFFKLNWGRALRPKPKGQNLKAK